jgi:hypothetical protein
MTTLTYQERRALCNPILIGVVAGLATPLASVIWGIRQRSWSLSIAPVLVTAFGVWFVAGLDMSKLEQYSFQAAGGVTAGLIAYSLKKEQAEK